MTSNVKVWTQDAIKELLAANDKAVANAILALYARQTSDEQSSFTTRHVNGRGFNSADAEFLTSLARALPRYNNHMTPKQLRVARKMLPKYSRQLLEVAAEKGAMVDMKAKAEALTPKSPLFGRFA